MMDRKKFGIIALIVVIVLCVLFGIHEHNKPISPVVGNWSGADIDFDSNVTGHDNVIKLQTYNNHNFKLEINDNSTAEGKYSGKWEKTDDVNDNGDPIYALKLSNPGELDDDAEYFTVGGKNNILWVGPSNNQHLQAKLHKIN